MACPPTAHNLAIISLFLSAGCEDILAGLGHCGLRGLSTCCLKFSSDCDIGGRSSVGLGIGPSQVLTFLELLRLSKSRTWLSLCPRTTVSIAHNLSKQSSPSNGYNSVGVGTPDKSPLSSLPEVMGSGMEWEGWKKEPGMGDVGGTRGLSPEAERVKHIENSSCGGSQPQKCVCNGGG